MKKIITIIIPILLLASCSLQQTSLPKGDWTVMFYLGDDYSTIGLDADVAELTSSNVNTSTTRVLILYDGLEDGDSKLEILDSPFGLNSRTINLDDTSIPTVSSKELDMSSKDTLKKFIKYAKNKAPANNYALYFGSHGAGYRLNSNSGLAIESSSGSNTMLETTVIASALEETGGVDLLVFDVCVIGNIETVYEFKDSVDYLVASPENIPGAGNQYKGIIKTLYTTDSITPFSLGKQTLEAHYTHYINDYTETRYNQIKDNDTNGHNPESLQQLYDIKGLCTIFDSNIFKTILLDLKSDKPSDATAFDYDYVDIYDIFNNNTSKYETIKSSFDSYITKADNGIYKWISIYIPSIYNEDFTNSKFAQANPGWVNVLKNP